MLLPSPRYTFAADRAGLVDPHAHPGDAEFIAHDPGNALGQRFHELKAGVADELLHALGDRLVIERVLDAVACRRFTNIGRHLQIDRYGLANPALPFPDADDGVDPKVMQENDVHSVLTVWRLRPVAPASQATSVPAPESRRLHAHR